MSRLRALSTVRLPPLHAPSLPEPTPSPCKKRRRQSDRPLNEVVPAPAAETITRSLVQYYCHCTFPLCECDPGCVRCCICSKSPKNLNAIDKILNSLEWETVRPMLRSSLLSMCGTPLQSLAQQVLHVVDYYRLHNHRWLQLFRTFSDFFVLSCFRRVELSKSWEGGVQFSSKVRAEFTPFY
jgi:hypothetical protein